MNATIAALILEALVKFGPPVARAITELFSKEVITKEDWAKVFDLAEKPYESYLK
jgi:hypothetical protein